jgi:hypothetical protein
MPQYAISDEHTLLRGAPIPFQKFIFQQRSYFIHFVLTEAEQKLSRSLRSVHSVSGRIPTEEADDSTPSRVLTAEDSQEYSQQKNIIIS